MDLTRFFFRNLKKKSFWVHFPVGNFKEYFGEKTASNPLEMGSNFGPKDIGRKNPGLHRKIQH